MTDEPYARDWVLSHFHFHNVTAYAILRDHGVTIGEAGCVLHMFAYLEPGHTPPGQP